MASRKKPRARKITDRRARPSPPPRTLRVPGWLPPGIFLLTIAVLFGEFIFSDRMLYGEDSFALGYMARAYFAEQLQRGDFPLWNPRLLGGIPFIEALAAGDSVYPTSLLYFISEPYRALGWKLVLHVLAGGFFMYGWTRSLGLGRSAATLSGLAWLMAPVVVTLVLPGNDGKLMVAALAPLVFWAVESLFRKPSGRAGAALAGAVALTCLTTQFQTAYFLFLSVGAYAVFRTTWILRGRSTTLGTEGKRFARGGARAVFPLALFLGSALVGAGLAAFQLLPAARYVAESSRRTTTTVEASPEEALAYSRSWSLHPEEVFGMVVPEFVGSSAAEVNGVQGTYWGRNALKLNHEYLGVTVLVFAVFALFGRRKRGIRGFMFCLGGLWLLFALGAHTPVWRVFYEVVPGIRLFRVPAVAAFLVSFGVTTLFAFGVDDLVRGSRSAGSFFRDARGRALLVLFGLFFLGFLCQSSGFLERIWMTLVYPDASPRSAAVLAALSPAITRGFGIALLLGALSVGLIWAVVEGRVPVIAALAVLAGLVAVDLGRVDRTFIRTFDFHMWAAPTANTRFLGEQRENEPPFRVSDLRGNDQNVEFAMFGLDLVAGHHPNDLARYRKLLGLEGSRRLGANTRHPNILRMLNVKYLVWPEETAGGPPFPGARVLSTAGTPSGAETVYAYPGLDRAWVVGTAVPMDDDSALARILSPDFNPGREAILAPTAQAKALRSGVGGLVVWEANEPDYRRLRVRSDGPGLLVVSENWFPGWIAEVNGESVPVHRVNLTLQAVEIPEAGEHRVTLRFTAPSVRSALRITGASAVAVVFMLLASFLSSRQQRARNDPGPEDGATPPPDRPSSAR